MKQEELRNHCKYLKWNKGIPYNRMAETIGMNKYSFYNFIAGKKASLGYKKAWSLEQFIKEIDYDR